MMHKDMIKRHMKNPTLIAIMIRNNAIIKDSNK